MVEFLLHKAHGFLGVLEELSIALAEIVQARLSIGSKTETVLRTFAIADKRVIAFTTLAGESPTLCSAKFLLTLTIKHFGERLLVDIAQLIFRKDKVVATIYIAVIFHHPCMAAAFRH